jgi:hypothetical protein
MDPCVACHIPLSSSLLFCFVDDRHFADFGKWLFSRPTPDTFCEGKCSAIIVEANCGQKDGTDVIVPNCTCCNRKKSRLIRCDEDLLLSSITCF